MTRHWQDQLGLAWGRAGRLTQLDGEFDLNFGVDGTEPAILKIMRADCDRGLVEMQIAALAHLHGTCAHLPVPQVLPSLSGQQLVEMQDPAGKPRLAWMLSRLDGRCWGEVRPQDPAVFAALGRCLAHMGVSLRRFEHPALDRAFKWHPLQSDWIAAELDCIEAPARRSLIDEICQDYAAIGSALSALPTQAIHNDANDYNLMVDGQLGALRLSGVIDFGDMCRAPRICDLATAAAYAVLGADHPRTVLEALVGAYHDVSPLLAEELDLLWPLMRMRLAVSVVNSALMARTVPDDPYVTISQGPAWQFLESDAIDPTTIRARLRVACGLPVTDAAPAVLDWIAARRGGFAPVLGMDLEHAETRALSVEAVAIPRDPFAMTAQEAAQLGGRASADAPWLGFYGEPRLIYTDAAFRAGSATIADRRTVHLGVDVFAPAGTPVQAPCVSTVVHCENRLGNLDYGGMVILGHEAGQGETFYSLYGHLDPDSFAALSRGDKIAAGTVFARLGAEGVNGGWNPHLHFQLSLDTSGMGRDWPGVADPDDLPLWQALCPNPAALLNLPDAKVLSAHCKHADVAARRRAQFAPNLKLSYDRPVMALRGWQHYLFDEWGRPFLDAYNNVPHVGHAHPRLRDVAADQMARVNTNTRYLHPAQSALAEALLAKLPGRFEICYFVNSGSEANELALRLARAVTGGRDMITPDHGYHGNTTGAVDISAYKFNARGGSGQPGWVHLVDVADTYRGLFRADHPDPAAAYAGQIDGALASIAADDGRLAGFIAETYPSVGGQLIPPPNYLPLVYDKIRAAGGVCIADEVQTGLGRIGSHYFAFEEQGAVPDIIVLGKPLGNGHPVGAVITTRAISEAFAQGPEFFSTFGGSTLSCRLALEVLGIVEEEGLMEHALHRGTQLLDGLRSLQQRHAVIGDVRGRGLFVGVDLVSDRTLRTPDTALAAFVTNRLRARRILTGTEGPAHNILKIRPPLTIGASDIAVLLDALDDVLSEARRWRG